MVQYDGPPYPYTDKIPPGTTALRVFLQARYALGRTEVIRDRARCAAQPSEHCSCRAVDLFTADKALRSRIARDLIARAEQLGVQSVIWDRQVWGYGRESVRPYHGADPHTSHVHVGLNKAGAQGLTPLRVAALWTAAASTDYTQPPIGGLEMLTPDDVRAVVKAVWAEALTDTRTASPQAASRLLEWAHQDAADVLTEVRRIAAALEQLVARDA